MFVDHPVAHAPTVLAVLVDLDFGRHIGGGEGLAQLVLGVRLALVVVGGNSGYPREQNGDAAARV